MINLKSRTYYENKSVEVNRAIDEAFDNKDISKLNTLIKLDTKISGLITLAMLRENKPELFSCLVQGLDPSIAVGI